MGYCYRHLTFGPWMRKSLVLADERSAASGCRGVARGRANRAIVWAPVKNVHQEQHYLVPPTLHPQTVEQGWGGTKVRRCLGDEIFLSEQSWVKYQNSIFHSVKTHFKLDIFLGYYANTEETIPSTACFMPLRLGLISHRVEFKRAILHFNNYVLVNWLFPAGNSEVTAGYTTVWL